MELKLHVNPCESVVGPTRASLVTYLFPLGGVILGVIFLDEQLSWQLLAGTALIISSLAVVYWNPKLKTENWTLKTDD